MRQAIVFCNVISKELGIVQGNGEPLQQWECRVLYSALGRMAQASLWDKVEDGPVSVEHFKRKTQKLINAYQEMFTGLSGSFSDPDQLAEEIYRIYEKTGLFYHEPFRIIPALHTVSYSDNIFFLRSPNLKIPVNMSGLGFYSTKSDTPTIESVNRHFSLQDQPLGTLWDHLISKANWSPAKLDGRIEYLRNKPPFSHGYWENEPLRDGSFSLLRTGEKGQEIYYLYYYDNDQCYISAVPEWRTKGSQYRQIANNYLARQGTLPMIKYKEKGSIVAIRLDYLLPPNEMSFLELYSWPSRYADLPSPFNRIMQLNVFKAFMSVFQQIGYVFEKDK